MAANLKGLAAFGSLKDVAVELQHEEDPGFLDDPITMKSRFCNYLRVSGAGAKDLEAEVCYGSPDLMKSIGFLYATEQSDPIPVEEKFNKQMRFSQKPPH